MTSRTKKGQKEGAFGRQGKKGKKDKIRNKGENRYNAKGLRGTSNAAAVPRVRAVDAASPRSAPPAEASAARGEREGVDLSSPAESGIEKSRRDSIREPRGAATGSQDPVERLLERFIERALNMALSDMRNHPDWMAAGWAVGLVLSIAAAVLAPRLQALGFPALALRQCIALGLGLTVLLGWAVAHIPRSKVGRDAVEEQTRNNADETASEAEKRQKTRHQIAALREDIADCPSSRRRRSRRQPKRN